TPWGQSADPANLSQRRSYTKLLTLPMASDAGTAQYQARSICECIHARWRNWDLRQLTVRGIDKVRAVVLWYALTNNILQGHRLANA
ncbi:transposase, partial [Bradyrhizobium sp. 31Argb]